MTSSFSLTDATFSVAVEHSRGLLLVDCWAPWCAPCLLVSPLIHHVSCTYAGRVRVATANVDETPAVVARFAVRSIPTLLLFEDGELVASLLGVVSQQRVAAVLDAHLAPRAA